MISDAFGFWAENSDLSIQEGADVRADILIDFSMWGEIFTLLIDFYVVFFSFIYFHNQSKEHGDQNSFDGRSGTLGML